MKQPMKHPRRILRKIVYAIVAVFLLASISLCGALLYLRSPSGADFLQRTINGDLASFGLRLDGKFDSSQLPSGVSIADITLEDADGAWLHVDLATLSLSFSEILSKKMTVTSLLLEAPHLSRMPKILPEPKSAEQVSALTPPSSPLVLPFSLYVTSLVVQKARLDEKALSETSPELLVTASLDGRAEPGSQNKRITLASIPAELQDIATLLSGLFISLEGKVNASVFVDNAPLDFDIHFTASSDQGNISIPALAVSSPGVNLKTSLAVNLQDGAVATDINLMMRKNASLLQLLPASQTTAPAAQAQEGAATTLAKANVPASEAASATTPAEEGAAQSMDKKGSRLQGSGSEQVTGNKLPVSGNLTLTANLKSSLNIVFDSRVPFQGTLVAEGDDLSAVDPILDQMLNKKLAIDALFSGGNGAPFSLNVRKATTGNLSLDGAAEFVPEKRQFSARFSTAINDIHPLYPAAKGGLEAVIEAEGDQQKITSILTARSPAIVSNGLELSAITLKADSTITNPMGPRLTVDSSFTSSLKEKKSGLIQAKGNVTAQVPLESQTGNIAGVKPHNDSDSIQQPEAMANDTSIAITVTDLIVKGGGIDLEAAGTAITGATPSASGHVKAKVTDWRVIAALTNPAIKGKPASLDATLDPKGTLAASLDVPFLSLGVETFEVNNLSANVQAHDVLEKPSFKGMVTVGQGAAAAIPFGGANIDVHGTGEDCLFNIDVYEAAAEGQQSRAASQAQKTSLEAGKPHTKGRGQASSPAKTVSQPAKAPAYDTGKTGQIVREKLLAAKGAYSQAQQTLHLESFSAKVPQKDLAIDLQKPLTVSFAEGIAAKGVLLSLSARLEENGNAQQNVARAVGAQQRSDTTKVASKPQVTARGTTAKSVALCATVPSSSKKLQSIVSGDIVLSKGKSEIKAEVSTMPTALIAALTGASVPEGAVTLKADIRQTEGALRGSVVTEASLSPIPSTDGTTTPPLQLRVNALIAAKPSGKTEGVTPRRNVSFLQGTGTLTVGNQPPHDLLVFDIPLALSDGGLPMPDMTAPFGVKLVWNGQVTPLWLLAGQPDRSFAGEAQINLSAGGTLEKPLHSGSAYLAKGSYQDTIAGVLLTDITVELHNTGGTNAQALISARDGDGGTLAMEATISSGQNRGNSKEKEFSPMPEIALRGQLNHFAPLHRDDLYIRLSGLMNIHGPLAYPKIQANLEVERGDVSILSTMRGSVQTLPVSDDRKKINRRAQHEPLCDIHIAVPNRFFIRGMGLDSEWKGNLNIEGPASRPQLTGSLTPVRGTLELLSKTFQIAKGTIAFDGGEQINPAVDLTLAHESDRISALVQVSGTATKPSLELSSEPALPRDEIMSEILFGKSSSNLSRFEALQVANAMRELANPSEDGLLSLTTVRKTLGIDVLRLGSTKDSGPEDRTKNDVARSNLGESGSSKTQDQAGQSNMNIEAGKYINDSIYIGVEQGATPESTGVRVEVELLPRLSVQGKSSARSSEVGVGWKMDY